MWRFCKAGWAIPFNNTQTSILGQCGANIVGKKYNSAAVLRGLLEAHPELSKEVERLAHSLSRDSSGRDLLADVRKVFDAQGLIPGSIARLRSKTLTEALTSMERRPWANIGRSKRPITAHRLARMLLAYGIRPANMQINGKVDRGYARAQFEEVAWGSASVNMSENVKTNGIADTSMTLGKCQSVRRFIINCLYRIRTHLPFHVKPLF
jgi:hypothetical protein